LRGDVIDYFNQPRDCRQAAKADATEVPIGDGVSTTPCRQIRTTGLSLAKRSAIKMA
jgi:hypothetical protein